MTKRDFFRIIIKLFGLYSAILAIFNFAPANIGYTISQFDPMIILFLLGATFISLFFLFLLIFKADWIINFLKLDKGFDDDRIVFERFNTNSIMKVSIILIGGYMIVSNVPHFLSHCFYAFRDNIESKALFTTFDSYGSIDYFNFAVSVINILVGYFLIKYYSHISNWFSKTSRE